MRIRLTGTIKQTKEKTKALTQSCYGKITSNTQVGHMKVRFAASQTLKIKPRDRQKIYLTLLSTSVILKLLLVLVNRVIKPYLLKTKKNLTSLHEVILSAQTDKQKDFRSSVRLK